MTTINSNKKELYVYCNVQAPSHLYILGFSPIVILLNLVGSHFFCGFQSVHMHNVITIIRVCCYISLKTLGVYSDCVCA